MLIVVVVVVVIVFAVGVDIKLVAIVMGDAGTTLIRKTIPDI